MSAVRPLLRPGFAVLCILFTPLTPAHADTAVSGTISASTTWTLANSPYVVTGDLTVAGAASPVLTIEPGVVVKVNDSRTVSIGSATQPGTLLAVGTSQAPIRFTTSRATVGAETWRGLWFEAQATSASRLANATVEAGGWNNNGTEGGILVNGSSPTIENVTVTTNSQGGIRIYGGAPVIRSCAVTNTTRFQAVGIDIYGGSPTITDTAVTGNAGAAFAIQKGVTLNGMTGLTVTGNSTNIVRYRSTTIDQNETWRSFGVPYRPDASVTVAGAGSPTLTIEPGLTVQMNDGQTLSIGSATQPGTLLAVGTAQAPIRFTTSRAAVGAETWRGLWFEAQATSASRLANATVEAGGWNNNGTEGGILVNGSSPTIENVTVTTNSQGGVRIYGGAPVIRNSTVTNTTRFQAVGIDIYGGSPTITDTAVTGNAGAAFAIQKGVTLNGMTGLTVSGNSTNIVRYRSTTIDQNETWRSFGVPYRPDASVTVAGAGSPTLTIEPGLTVQMNDGQTLSIGSTTQPGTLLAVGTSQAPIRFTTSRATVGAETWRGLWFEAQATSASRLANATVEAGGWNNNGTEGGILVNGSSPTIENVTVTTNSQGGIRIYGGAPVIRSCAVTNTTRFQAVGIDIYGGSPTITDTAVTGNAGAAFAIQKGVTLNGMTGLTVTGNSTNIVRYRSTTIDQNETWRSFGVPYRPDASVTVAGAGSPTLTIEPGLTVQMNDGQTLSIGSATQPGTLLAVGTAQAPIRFTTSRAAVGAETWRGLWFEAQATSASRLANATVEAGGWNNNGTEGGILVNGSSPTIENVTVTTNSQGGVRIYGGAPVIRNSTVANTTRFQAVGIDIYGGSPTITDTSITGNAGAAFAIQGGVTLNGMTGLTVSGNGQNMVRFRSPTLTVDQTWPSFGIPYRPDGSLTVAAAGNPTLTIAPGVTVQVNDGQTFSIGSASQPGTLIAAGTLAEPIRFTTSRASVVPGTWRGLWFEARATTASRLENAIVEAGGWNNNGNEAGIVVNGSSPTFEAVTVRQNAQLGIRVNAGGPVIRNCVIRDNPGNTTTGLSLSPGVSAKASFNSILNNGGSGITNSSSTASLRFNTVSGNGFEALRSFAGAIAARDNVFAGNGQKVRNDDATRTVDVRQQWWGDANGPTGLAARIEFDPWLGSPPTQLYAVATFHRSTAAFNPTGAGVYFTFTLPAPGTWTLRVETSGGTEVKTFTGSGASGQVLWNGTDLASTAVADATYTYRFNATETATATAAAPLVGRVAVDRTIPIALLTAPLPGASITAPITVTGSAAGTGFTNYVLEAGDGEFPPTVTTVDRRSVATTAGTLGQWSALLDKSLYTLRLTVNGTGGKKAVSEALLTPAGQAVCP